VKENLRKRSKEYSLFDDDEDIRRVLTEILVGEGYIVDSVGTGMEAVRKTEEKFYNLALMDIRLPDMEGVELLTKIKETKPKMRRIIVMGYPTFKMRLKP